MNTALKNDIEQLTATINKFLAKFDLTCRCGIDFGYYYAENVIEYALIVPKNFDDSFTAFLNRYDITAPIFIWSLFHEIGHAETEDFFEAEAINEFANYKNNLDPYNDRDVMEYYNCPDELLATNWAYLYIKDNYDEVMHFWNEVSKMINDIYTTYEISI